METKVMRGVATAMMMVLASNTCLAGTKTAAKPVDSQTAVPFFTFSMKDVVAPATETKIFGFTQDFVHAPAYQPIGKFTFNVLDNPAQAKMGDELMKAFFPSPETAKIERTQADQKVMAAITACALEKPKMTKAERKRAQVSSEAEASYSRVKRKRTGWFGIPIEGEDSEQYSFTGKQAVEAHKRELDAKVRIAEAQPKAYEFKMEPIVKVNSDNNGSFNGNHVLAGNKDNNVASGNKAQQGVVDTTVNASATQNNTVSAGNTTNTTTKEASKPAETKTANAEKPKAETPKQDTAKILKEHKEVKKKEGGGNKDVAQRLTDFDDDSGKVKVVRPGDNPDEVSLWNQLGAVDAKIEQDKRDKADREIRQGGDEGKDRFLRFMKKQEAKKDEERKFKQDYMMNVVYRYDLFNPALQMQRLLKPPVEAEVDNAKLTHDDFLTADARKMKDCDKRMKAMPEYANSSFNPRAEAMKRPTNKELVAMYTAYRTAEEEKKELANPFSEKAMLAMFVKMKAMVPTSTNEQAWHDAKLNAAYNEAKMLLAPVPVASD